MHFATADLHDEHGHLIQVLEPGFRSFGGLPMFAGPVATVKTYEDNSRVREAVGEPGEGRVLVVDGGGSLRCALLGDKLAGRAVQNGWKGLVVWGCVRDTAILHKLPLGVLALAPCPARSRRRDQGVRDVEVSFGGVTFRPCQVLYADHDGVVVAEKALELGGGADVGGS